MMGFSGWGRTENSSLSHQQHRALPFHKMRQEMTPGERARPVRVLLVGEATLER